MKDIVQVTGFTEHAIRVWEKRYGKPVPERLPSGHRRYTHDQMQWLLQVKEALSQGHRISDVIHQSEEFFQGLDETVLKPDEEHCRRPL